MSGENFVDYMAPKREESPPEGEEIPTGWDVKYEVQKDGALKTSYYCPDTKQRFYTYRSLIHYVDYAKKRRFGPYGPMCRPDQIRIPVVPFPVLSPSPSPRKTTGALSIPGWPRQSSSDSDDDSESSRESSDVEEDEESVPKKDAAVFTEFGTDAAGKRYKVAQKRPIEEVYYKDTWQWSKTFRRGGLVGPR